MSSKTWVVVLIWASTLCAIVSMVVFRQVPTPTPAAKVIVAAQTQAPSVSDEKSAFANDQSIVAASSKDNPSMYRMDERHTGRSSAKGPAVPPSVLWKLALGARIVAQPVMSSDGTLWVGAHDKHFYKIGAAGDVVWKEELGGLVYGTAWVRKDGRAFVGSDATGVYSVGKGGKVRFLLKTQADADTGVMPFGKDRLIVASGKSVWCITANGLVKWEFKTKAKVFATPAISEDQHIYVASQDNHIYALNASGEMEWSFRTRGDNDSSPVVGDDGTIFVGSDDKRVYALKPNGKLKWVKKLKGMIRGPLALTFDGGVVAGTLGPTPQVVSMDAKSGKVRWTYDTSPVDSTQLGVLSGVTVDADSALYFASQDGTVSSLSPSGQLRWTFNVGSDVSAPLVLSNTGTLFVGSDEGNLFALQ